MTQVQILPPAAKFLKKLKDKKLKSLYKEAIEMICEDYSIGEEKTGDLAGMYGYDIYYNKTNYELAYRVRQLDDLIIIVIMAGTMIKIMTTNNSRNSGTKSFVPASSPIFRARFLRSSKASSTSVRKSSRRFFVPVFRFCSRMLLSFR